MDDKSKRDANGLEPTIETSAEAQIEKQQAIILRLQQDLETCLGKIKGYKTLGHLLQESKFECARYKQTNEDLAKRLDSLSRSLRPLGTMDDKPGAAGATLVVQGGSVQEWSAVEKEGSERSNATRLEKLSSDAAALESVKDVDKMAACSNAVACSENVTGNVAPQSHKNAQAAEPYVAVGVNLDELGAKNPPTMSPGRNPEGSDFSSVSFVGISNSQSPESGSSRRSSGFDQIEQGIISGNDDLSSKISHLTKHLETIGISGSASVEDLSTNLIQASVLVTRLQREARIQQVMISEMSKQISELKADNVSKQQSIQILQKESDSLRNTMKRMVTARVQAVQDNESARESNFGSLEWVELEDRQTAGKTTADTGPGVRQVDVNSVPITEVELRNRIEKLNATVTELVSVNHGWDNHCRQLTASHEQQIVAMQSMLNESQLRCDEYERAASNRKREFEDMLLGVKKQREADEIAKGEALSAHNIEKSRRVTTELKNMELTQKNVELERRLAHLDSMLQAGCTPPNVPAMRQRVEPSSTREEELATQLLIVQEQVNIFKEDFDRERRDRESAVSDLESMRKIQKDITDQLYAAVNQLARTMSDLETAKKECDRWKQLFNKLSDEVQALQRTARPQEARLSTETGAVGAAQAMVGAPAVGRQSPVASNLAKFPSWNCLTCTFKNSGLESRCEMCGKLKPDEFQQSSSFPIGGGGQSLSGLQSWNPEAAAGTWLIPRGGYDRDVPDKSL